MLKKILINISPALLMTFIIAIIWLQSKYQFINVVVVPRVISFDKYNNNLAKSKNPSLNGNYMKWIENNYVKHINTKLFVRKDLSYSEMTKLGGRFIAFFDSNIRIYILYILLFLNFFLLIAVFIFRLKNGYNIYMFFDLPVVLLFLIVLFIFGASMIEASWP